MSQPLTTHSHLHLYLHLLIYLPITHSHPHLFFQPSILSSISQSLTTHYIFIHPFVLSPISQLTILSSILSSSDPSPNQLLIYYILIHQKITHPLTSFHPHIHQPMYHAFTTCLSTPPSSHLSANYSTTTTSSNCPSILSTIDQILTHSLHLHWSFHPFILSTISPSLTTHYTFIHLSILSSISQPLTH